MEDISCCDSDKFISKISERLKISEEDLKKGFMRKIITTDEYKGTKILSFKKKLKHIERGTIVFLNDNIEYIMGYPKIRRAMTLYPTLKKYFIDKIVVEEKLDGYNIRIANINDEVIAITRGGKICPFTTKKVSKFLSNSIKILDDYPDLMLCGEMVGLNNPYVSHYYPEVDKELSNNEYENLGFYIFDIRNKETNNPLSINEKEKMLKKYNIPYVKPLGIFDKEGAHEKVRELIETLSNEQREGVVLKDPDMAVEPIKYTTHYTQCNDLSVAFEYMYDLGIDFMFSRIVREGYQSFEFGENEEEMERRALDLGKSILYPMVNSIKKVSQGGTISEDFEIFMDSEEDIAEFVAYLKKLHINFTIKNKEKIDNGIYKVKIGRIYSSTNDRIKSHLNGNLW
ncbi:MAG: putative ATP-dependent ligase [Methanothermococcus sp.]|jgi:putative ATP-dependent DNA ligase|uniref:RNA ligase n=1 Tax=Methanothermococcus TaxID=155862 RepID=UPI000364F4A6|nr:MULTISPECIES: RNA ligase [Methanothermococcus]MDK2790997.1 putative ATP-dependent ligase [Methanothermococcus sp.]MDK2988216.1 putative ATP-dependent ligase [Methanothermococcus sp.]